MPALIDVLIPVYNGGQFLRQAIQSIQHQTITDIRIIAVDDGSTDNTAEILAELAAADDRIEIIYKQNGGIVDALNLGLARCDAEFIARHDADDNAYPDRFDVQIRYLKAHPDCVALSCTIRHIDEAGRPIGTTGRGPAPERANPTIAPALEPYLIHPFLMVRRHAIQAVGGYRHIHHAEDTDLYWRLRDVGRLHNLHQILGEYRMHGGSISGGSISNGRMMSLCSQLSAISAVRREAGLVDLTFTKEAVAEYKAAANDLNALYQRGCEGLTAPEASFLKIAVSAKLIELAAYRPYEVTTEDCKFLKSAALNNMAQLTPANKALLRRGCSGTAARLASTGKWTEARALVWPALLPTAIYRWVLRLIFPPGLRSTVKKIVLTAVNSVKQRRYRTASVN